MIVRLLSIANAIIRTCTPSGPADLVDGSRTRRTVRLNIFPQVNPAGADEERAGTVKLRAKAHGFTKMKAPFLLGRVDEISTDDVFGIPLRNRA